MGVVKNFILGISIAIIFAFFIGFGIETFYPSPEYSDFCDDTKGFIDIATQEACDAAGGKWNAFSERPAMPEIESNQLLCTKIDTVGDEMQLICEGRDVQQKSNGYCDQRYYCAEEYDDVREVYEKNLFIIAVFIGLLTMILGGFVLKHESVSPGLMGGGFITILYGVIRYWQFAGDWLRFMILGFVLAMLIYLAYKKLPFKKS